MNKFFASLLILTAFSTTVVAQEQVTFGGFHTQLFGYTDKRYVGADKGDYLKTVAWYSGIEYLQRNVVPDSADLESFVLGAAGNLYVQNPFQSLDLYEVPSKSIDAETILSDPVARAGRFQVTLTGFGGFEEDWWAAQVGLSVFLKGFNEASRQKYNASGTIVDVAGRGWVFDSSLILPNFRLRVGPESLPHFIASFLRGSYDPGYGALQVRVAIPISGVGSVDVGGSVYQTASLFLEPAVTLGDWSLAVRAGTVLNYYDENFTRVGIFEGAFLGASLRTRW